MIRSGDLVNNIHTADYNHGVVLETGLNVTDEMYISDEEELKLIRIQNSMKGEPTSLYHVPEGIRVMWKCGDINIHYADELEIVNEGK